MVRFELTIFRLTIILGYVLSVLKRFRGQINWQTHLVVEIAKNTLLNKIVQMRMQLLNAFCHFRLTVWPLLTFWSSKMIEFNFDFLSFKTVFALTSVGFHFIPINTRFNPNFIGFRRFPLTVTEFKQYKRVSTANLTANETSSNQFEPPSMNSNKEQGLNLSANQIQPFET